MKTKVIKKGPLTIVQLVDWDLEIKFNQFYWVNFLKYALEEEDRFIGKNFTFAGLRFCKFNCGYPTRVWVNLGTIGPKTISSGCMCGIQAAD